MEESKRKNMRFSEIVERENGNMSEYKLMACWWMVKESLK